MFIGHFAVGFALKRVAPRASLGILIAAPMFLDLLWPWFLLLGWERVRIDPGNTDFTPLAFDRYPISHSLLMSALWGLLFGGLYLTAGRSIGDRGRRAAAVWVTLAVVSHWVLDWMTHRPDLPLTPWGATRLGLGLWNSIPATIAVEVAMFAAAVWVYVSATPSFDRRSRIRLGVYVAVLGLIYLGNVFGPPPPHPHAIALAGLGLWLFPIWAAWIDRAPSAL